ncbi:MAG: hypothetical protein JWL83_3880 [Actinomycetia bacterium]|nr:hypothetical protein [Actinomycetes bacterium]
MLVDRQRGFLRARRAFAPVALVVACGASALVPMVAHVAEAGAASTVTVTPADPSWGFVDGNAHGGLGQFVTGPPAAPAGTGSVELAVTASNQGYEFGAGIDGGTDFANLTNLEYSTYTNNGAASNRAIALDLSVDYDNTDATTAWQGRVVWIPASIGAGQIVDGTWQTWSPLTQGKWFSSGTPIIAGSPTPSSCSQATPCTWAQLTANYPNAEINVRDPQVLLKNGSGYSNFDAFADKVVVGIGGNDTTYDFEPGGAQATNVVVNGATFGWGFADDNNAGGHGKFVKGPKGRPLGHGSAQIAITKPTQGYLFGTGSYLGHGATRFSQITKLGYSTYRNTIDAGNNLAIAMGFSVDYDLTDVTTSWQGRLVFEPYLASGGGTIPRKTWQTWNALTAPGWYGSSASPKVGNATVAQQCTMASPCTLAQVIAAYPNAGINPTDTQNVFKAGSGWTAKFTGSVDKFVIGVGGNDTTYDFEK